MDRPQGTSLEIITSHEPVDYKHAMCGMERLRDDVISSEKLGYIWFLEHKDVFTIGTSGSSLDVKDVGFIPVIKTNRGGKVTYHGPGQRVIYFIVDLKKLHDDQPDMRKFISDITSCTIKTLATFGIEARRDEENIGVWVEDAKIASIGVRIKHWVTTHGIAINIAPNLDRFSQIVPCGLQDVKMCSMESLGKNISIDSFDEAFKNAFYGLNTIR